MNDRELETHCRETHVRGLPGDQEPYLSDTFEPGFQVSWEMVHRNLHRLAGKHGEPAHKEGGTDAEAGE